jgi:hypothetical protein
VGPRGGLDEMAKRQNPTPCPRSNSGHPARSLVTILRELPRPQGKRKRKKMIRKKARRIMIMKTGEVYVQKRVN